MLAACAAPLAAPPHHATPAAPRAISADQPLGWIALAPRPVGAAREVGDWLPVGAHMLVPRPTEGSVGLAAGDALAVIDTAGAIAHVTVGAPIRLPYGCDRNQLDAIALTGERLAPGVLWLLPAGASASWQPRPLAIATGVESGPARRRDTVGPLELELVRRDDTHATLAISRSGRLVHTAPITRVAIAGADAEPLDLGGGGVAIPAPVAAWSIGLGTGAILLVLQVPAYEGTHLTPILVEPDRAREVTAMAVYLYRCAF